MSYRKQTDLIAFVHVGGYGASGRGNELEWMAKGTQDSFECQIQIFGCSKGCGKHVDTFNRSSAWRVEGKQHATTEEADSRHFGIIVKGLGLDNAKTFPGPIAQMGEGGANSNLDGRASNDV